MRVLKLRYKIVKCPKFAVDNLSITSRYQCGDFRLNFCPGKFQESLNL